MSASQISPGSTDPRHLYHRNGLLVTTEYIQTHGRRYAILDVTDLLLSRGSLHPGTVVGLTTAVGEAVVVTPVAVAIGAPSAWVFATIALLIPCAVAAFCAHRWPPRLGLLARCRGVPVCLYDTRDPLEFGKVTRAMQRAMEATRGDDY